MTSLIEQSREHFIQIRLYEKLYRRFWHVCEAYSNGKSYSDVLKLYFSGSCKAGVLSHRRIGDSNVVVNQN